jgi:phosphoserine phosphatase
LAPPPDPRYALVAFDVDGTLVDSEDGKVVWQLLNRRFGADDGSEALLFESFCRREITYAQWVELDIRGWRDAGATRQAIAEVILDKLRPVRGARETIEALRASGLKVVVISGTLDLTLELLFPDSPFEETFTNRIWFDELGRIAGWEATPYDMEGKARGLEVMAGRFGVPLDRTVYVGDNWNDLGVMARAGLAVAFQPKHADVARAAHAVLREDLRGLLELLAG